MTKKGKGPHPVHKTYVAIGGSLVALILFAAIFVYLVPTQFVGKAGETGPVCVNVPDGIRFLWSGDTSQVIGPLLITFDSVFPFATYPGFPLVLANGATIASGKVNNSIRFYGDGSVAVLGDLSLLEVGASDFTFEAWIFTLSPTAPQTIVVHALGGDGYGLILNLCGDGKICVLTNLDNAIDGVSADIPLAEWTHIAAVRSGTQVTFYVNGVNKGSVTVAETFGDSVSLFSIGAFVDPATLTTAFGFLGAIDEFSMYGRALTAAEIQSIYTADSAGKCKLEQICNDGIDDDQDGDMDCADSDCQQSRSLIFSRSQEYAVTLRADDCPGAEVSITNE